jgi:NTE family protein
LGTYYLRCLWELDAGFPDAFDEGGLGPRTHQPGERQFSYVERRVRILRAATSVPLASPRGSIEATSFYDASRLKDTLESLVDFDRINAREMRFSVGAVNVRSANFVYFDSTTHTIRPEHVMASGALPPGFAAVEIDGERYWDGGLISNTPLQWVLDSTPRQDTLAFPVDLWSARGDFPGNMAEVETRQKEIQYSSRTRANTDQFQARSADTQHRRRFD